MEILGGTLAENIKNVKNFKSPLELNRYASIRLDKKKSP